MDSLDDILERMKAHLAAYPFTSSEWTCSKAELEAEEKQRGERMATDWIALANRKYVKPEKQAKELRFWCGIAGGFPASGIHAFPILVAAIRELEG